jgi:hypothetical protein
MLTGVYKSRKTEWRYTAALITTLIILTFNQFTTSSQNLNATVLPAERTASAARQWYIEARELDVPYVNQGETNWCFQASLSMVLQYHGKVVFPSDIAESLGRGRDESLSFLDMFLGPVDSYLATWPDLSAGHHLLNWNFGQFVESIDKEVPVVVSTFGLPGHTIVVVGYSEEPGGQYLYVHDPSGFLSQLRWGGDSLMFAKVSWSVFSRHKWTQLVVQPVSPAGAG